MKVSELNPKIKMSFSDKIIMSDGDYEQGYKDGEKAGYNRGFTEGETKGIEQGKKAQYDEFWDAFQDNGNRTAYAYAFYGTKKSGGAWTKENFKPKYDIKPVGSGAYMFFQNRTNLRDLKTAFDEAGVVFDTSECTSVNLMFQDSFISHIGEFDLSKCINCGGMFAFDYYLNTVDKIIFSETTKGFNANSFNATNLENIIFDGVIAVNGIVLSNCMKLTHDSLMSLINHLKDYSTDTSGTSHSITLGATNLAKLTDAEKAIATQKGWTLA